MILERVAFVLSPRCGLLSSSKKSAVSSARRQQATEAKQWGNLTLDFISLRVSKDNICSGSAALRLHIEDALSKRAKPVRWAVVATDEKGLVVDAVVSRDDGDESSGGLRLSGETDLITSPDDTEGKAFVFQTAATADVK